MRDLRISEHLERRCHKLTGTGHSGGAGATCRRQVALHRSALFQWPQTVSEEQILLRKKVRSVRTADF